MPKCEKCGKWEFVSVSVKGKCVMLSRCGVCKEFGQGYCLVPEPFANSAEIQADEVPEEIRQYVEEVISRINDYPVYGL